MVIQNTIIFIRGYPGSGKTTLSKQLKKTYSIGDIDPDRLFLISLLFNKSRMGQILKYRENLRLARWYLKKNKSFIWEQPWRRIENLENIINQIRREFPHYRLIVIELSLDPEISWERRASSFVDKPSFSEYLSKYKDLDIKEVEIFKIDANRGIEVVYNEVKLILESKNTRIGV